jgi:hypothetical protein
VWAMTRVALVMAERQFSGRQAVKSVKDGVADMAQGHDEEPDDHGSSSGTRMRRRLIESGAPWERTVNLGPGDIREWQAVKGNY